MNVLILHDEVGVHARPDEQDTLVQRDAVRTSLERLGHRVDSMGVTLDLVRLAGRLRADRPDLVFNLVESLASRGCFIHLPAFVVESLGVPMTGASATAVFTTSHKLIAKQLLQRFSIPTPHGWSGGEIGQRHLAGRTRIIVKSLWEHASVGLDDDCVLWVETHEEVQQAIAARRARLGGEAFAEEFIDGREFNVPLLGDGLGNPVALPPSEIVFRNNVGDRPAILGYKAKWETGSQEDLNSTRSFDTIRTDPDPRLAERLTRTAIDCWNAFSLRGYARVDIRMNAQGEMFVLEVNSNPCLSPDAGFAAALVERSMSYDEAIERIVAEAFAGR